MKQFQLVQDAPEAFRVLYVADATLDSATQSRIREEFQAILSTPVTIAFERVAEFARSRSGKFLQALSEIGVGDKTIHGSQPR